MKSWTRLLLVALVFGIALGDSGNGSENGDTGNSDEGEDGWGSDRSGRSMDVNSNKDKIELKGRNEASGDTLSFKFSTEGLPQWVLSYFSRDSDTEAASTSRWALWKMVEYTETGAAQGFQPEADIITKEYRLWLQTWSDMTVTQSTVDNATVYSFCTEMSTTNRGGDYKREENQGNPPFVLRICNLIADKPATVNGTKASPNALKWSLEISDYPYANNDTHLALKVAFDSSSEIREFSDDSTGPVRSSDQDALEISSDGNITTAITWTTNVDLEGTDCPATAMIARSAIYNAEVSEDADSDAPRGDSSSWSRSVQLAYYSFLTDCQPSTIFWDPEFGIVTSSVPIVADSSASDSTVVEDSASDSDVVENSASVASIVVGFTMLSAFVL